MKHLSRLVFLAGAIAIGFFLFRANPREVTLVYALASRPPVSALEVEITRDGEPIRQAEFRFPRGAPQQVEHKVKLPTGEYQLHFRITAASDGPPATLERDVHVSESETIVVPL